MLLLEEVRSLGIMEMMTDFSINEELIAEAILTLPLRVNIVGHRG